MIDKLGNLVLRNQFKISEHGIRRWDKAAETLQRLKRPSCSAFSEPSKKEDKENCVIGII